MLGVILPVLSFPIGAVSLHHLYTSAAAVAESVKFLPCRAAQQSGGQTAQSAVLPQLPLLKVAKW